MIEHRDSAAGGRSPRNAAVGDDRLRRAGWVHAIILRDITEGRRSAQPNARVRAD